MPYPKLFGTAEADLSRYAAKGGYTWGSLFERGDLLLVDPRP